MRIIKESEIPDRAFLKNSINSEIYHRVRQLDVGEALVVPTDPERPYRHNGIRNTLRENWAHKRKGWPKTKVMKYGDEMYILVVEKREEAQGE